MTKTFLYLASIALMMPALLTSCADDEPKMDSGVYHPQLGWLNKGTSCNVVGIESEANHQHNQDHRSSNNFNTSVLPDGDYFYWELDSAARADGVSFRVMKDNKGKKDDVIEEYVTHGSLTRVYRSEKLYIADPKNAKKKFQVTVSCVKDGEGSIYVTSAKDHQEGQKHRASSNFDFTQTLYEIILPNDNISFSICNDVTAAPDTYIYKDLKNGQVIARPCDYNLYISDVTGADGPFTVQFKPTVRVWMAELPDSKPITMLSIPGTHDTGTYNCWPGVAKCQNFDITYQLEFGIRAFDIRFDSEMDIRHGPTDCHIDMDDVLRQMNDFLDKYPSECILMILNQHADEDYPHLPKYFEDNPSMVRRVDRNMVTLPTLGQARGKILILRRFPKPEKSGEWGIDFTDWPNDGIKKTGIVTAKGDSVKYYIQDRYFSADETQHDTVEKDDLVYKTMVESTHGDKDRLYINYNSVAGRLIHTPWAYAWTIGTPDYPIEPYMMKSLYGNLCKMQEQWHHGIFRLGIVMLDYFNNEGNNDPYRNTESILNSNFESPIY